MLPHTRSRFWRSAIALTLAFGMLLPASLLVPAHHPLAPQRALGASIVVTTTAWALVLDGQCSLAEAYINVTLNQNISNPDCAAGSAVGVDVISFAVSGTILAGSLLHQSFHGDLVIDGAGQSVVLDGQDTFLLLQNDSGSVTVANLTLHRSGSDGIRNTGTLAVTGATISQSRRSGVRNASGGTATVQNSTITGSTGDPFLAGAGIHNGFSTLTVTNSTISNNSAAAGFSGGGLLNDNGTATIVNSTFSGNSAASGGGIAHENAGTLTISGSTISGNTASATGGGLSMSGGTATISNSTISGNTSGNNAGGVALASGFLTMQHVTIAGNTAVTGGGFRLTAGTPTLHNSIIGDNSATTGPDCSGGVIAGTAPNLIENTMGCNVVGTPAITGAPLLGPLAANGGPTLTHALLSGSPALSVANAAICAASPVSGLDQRGVARPQGPGCDLGAFEAAPLVIGGKNLTITTGSIDLSWDGGTAQNSYTLLKYNTSTALAELLPVAGSATSFSDATATSGIVYCYVLAALNGVTFLGLSDLLCGMAGMESGTVIPQNFNLKLGQTASATMAWAAPVGGADSYLLQRIPLDGSPITNLPLGGGVTTSTQPVTAAGTCFQLIAFKGAGFGTSDVLCGVPGVSTLALGGARTSASEALGQVAGRLESLWPAPRD